MHFEVVDLVRGGPVTNIPNDINLLRENFIFCFSFNSKYQLWLAQPGIASHHLHNHVLPALVALRPYPAAESCVDPQAVVNSVERSTLELQDSFYVVPSVCLCHEYAWSFSCLGLAHSPKKIQLLRGVTDYLIALK